MTVARRTRFASRCHRRRRGFRALLILVGLLAAGVGHASAVTTGLFFPFRPQTGLYLVWAIIVAVMIVADRMWHKLPPDHPAVYHPA